MQISIRMIIRKIEQHDNKAIAAIIRQVMTEFGASGEGFSIHDPEVDHMFETYNLPRSAFFVVEEGKVVGGAGIAPLAGGDVDICELKKMYFLPEARGKGMGKEIIRRCLESARAFGYRTCYIETIARMEAANKLYKSFGFKKITAPMGNTGHSACESFYALELE